MNLNHLSGYWSAVAPALGDHLWQSTLFAAVAGLLTLFLRKNQARTRYWLWLAASVKFLIPFSLLVFVGNYLAWSHASSRSNVEFYVSIEKFTQPFSQPASATNSISTLATYLANLSHLVPALLATVWFCGFAAVLFTWFLRWRRIFSAIRQAIPRKEGREAESLRRAERAAGLQKQIPLLMSDNSLEPGIFGIARPVLVWPQGISDRLEDAHLESILAHELWHVRRRDNLAAAIHMAVEALFWFHPLVWWLGSRLVEERELACDEAVLELGNVRQVYAESILKICEFCIGSPLNCVSGVTGADLKKRIAHIMKEDVMYKLNFGKKLLLGITGLAAIATPLLIGLLNATQSPAATRKLPTTATLQHANDSFSIKLNQQGTAALKTGTDVIRQNMLFKPGEYSGENNSLEDLLRAAFGVAGYQILGVPGEFNGQLFDVQAKANPSVLAEMQKLDSEQRGAENRRMLQELLENRLHLKFHREMKELPAFSMTVSTNGKLREAFGECPQNSGPIPLSEPGKPIPPPCGGMRITSISGGLEGQKVTMAQLVSYLANLSGKVVTDKTNLTGKYDITLKWLPQPTFFPEYTGLRPAPDPKAVPLGQALQEQLGLNLEPVTAPVEVLVIDHIEKPSEN